MLSQGGWPLYIEMWNPVASHLGKFPKKSPFEKKIENQNKSKNQKNDFFYFYFQRSMIHNSKSINFTLCVAELGKLSKWGKTKLIISFRPTIENRATFAVVVIIPLPLKKDWTLYNKSRSFICNSIINRACTTQPNFDFLILLLIEILKHPSASIRPVTNQGCNFSCGA